MDIKAGNPYPAGALSNFAKRPFMLDGVQCQSIEGFVQGLKFQDPEMQKQICSMHGYRAKLAGRGVCWQQEQTLYWKTEPIKRNSEQYQQLLDRAFVSMFMQNRQARQALISTGNENLTHSVGWHDPRDTVLTEKELCSRLMLIREQLKVQNLVKW